MDTIRGLAALGVAVYHFDLQPPGYAGDWFNEITSWGRYGVAAFFVLSGFCIQMLASRVSGMAEFFWQRFWRIYPPFLFSLAVITFSAVVRELTIHANDAAKFPRDWVSWLSILTTMVRPATPVRSLNWVTWSLSYEVIFYLIAGLLLCVKRWRMLVFIALSALSFVPHIWEVPGLFFLKKWSAFALGAGLFEWTRGERKQSGILVLMSLVQVSIGFTPGARIVVLVTTLTLLISIYRPESIFCRSNWFSHLGKFSYSFFLLHVPVGIFMFVGAQGGLWVGPFPRSFCVYLADLMLCLGVAYLGYLLVEKPSMNMGKQFARANAWSPWSRRPEGKAVAAPRQSAGIRS